MNDDFHNDEPGLIDDDPALDFIIYKEMEKEDKDSQGKINGGCLSLLLFLLVPPTSIYLLLDLIQ